MKPRWILLTLVLPAWSALAIPMEEVLKNVAAVQKKTTTLQASFRQEKTLGLLAKPAVSRGTFFYRKPNSALWEYSEPQPFTMLIANGTMTTYYPNLKKAERAAIRSMEQRIFRFMAAVSSVEELSGSFDFRFVDRAGDPYRLELTPKMPGASRYVKGITLWIDRSSYLVNGFQYTEADGDVTLYQFTDIRRNPPLPASKFALNLPPGVRVEQMKLGE